MPKKMVNPELTELLHKAFSCYDIDHKFNMPALFEAAFGHLNLKKKDFPEAKKICKNFIAARRQGGEMCSTHGSSPSPCSFFKQAHYCLYKKLKHASISQNIPMHIVPKVYYDILYAWNSMPVEKWVTIAYFRDTYLKTTASTDVISRFMRLASKDGFALMKPSSTKTRPLYKKKSSITKDQLKSWFVVFKTEKIGERINDKIEVSKQPHEFDIDARIIDPTKVTPREFYDTMIGTAIHDKREIERLTKELVDLKSGQKAFRRQVLSISEKLNKSDDIIIDLKKTVNHREGTITTLKSQLDKKRDIILDLRQQLEVANRKLELKNYPIDMTQIFRAKGNSSNV